MTGDRRDVEARLRDSLRAYADVVGDEPARHPAAGGARRSSALRGWRSSVLAAAAVLAVAGGTWLVVDRGDAPSPTAAQGADAVPGGGDSRAESAPESSAGAGAEAQSGSAFDTATPLSEQPRVGVAYPVDLYTHCGVLGADVGGVWFAADPPLVEESGPPAGWEDPYQRGTLTLESPEVAVFRDDAGHEVRLRAAPESERPPPCG